MKASASGDADPLSGGPGPSAASPRRDVDERRRLDSAAVGERVEFFEPPRVRSDSGAWVDAPSTTAEVAYHVGGTPAVRFVVAKDGRERRTRPSIVVANTPIRGKR
jgi:hypothetical protein